MTLRRIAVTGRHGQVARGACRSRGSGGIRDRHHRASATRPRPARHHRTGAAGRQAGCDRVGGGLYGRRQGGERTGTCLCDQRGRGRPGRRRGGRDGRAGRASVDRLRVFRRQGHALCGGGCGRSARDLRGLKTRRRARRRRRRPRSCHPAHGLGLQPVREQFRQDHATARGRSRGRTGGRRSVGMPDRGGRYGRGGASTVVDNLLAAPEDQHLRGLFHFTGRGETTWAGFAAAVFAASRRRGGPFARVENITTADYPTAARRPARSSLDSRRIAAVHGIAPWTGKPRSKPAWTACSQPDQGKKLVERGRLARRVTPTDRM